jgi:hypothetical protein
MSDRAKLVYDPQDLEPLLISRQWAGDVEGMVALLSLMPLLTTAENSQR